MVSPNNDVVSAIAGFTSGASYVPANWAVSSTYAGVAKFDNGGTFLKPVRVPTLTVERSWPDSNVDYRILWVESLGQTLYGFSPTDNSFRKSTDGGVTWTRKGYYFFGVNTPGAFLKTAAGTLLFFRPGSSAAIARSTDDGATWATATMVARSVHYPMGAQSWAIDPVTNYLYYGEYVTADTDTVTYVYRSTDDGATWVIWYTFPGYASGDPLKIRHIHSIQWDPYLAKIVVLTGDSDPAAGMYRVSNDGTTLVPLLLNSQVPGFTTAARSIGIIPFPNYLCWTGDSSATSCLFRVARTELANAFPIVTEVYRANSTAWFTCQASSDGSRWVFSSSGESPTTALDAGVHLYSVEDQGATVYEIGALSVPISGTGVAALSPVGSPGIHGDIFFMQSHYVTGRLASWKLTLAHGTTPMHWPRQAPRTFMHSTRQSPGSVVIPTTPALVIGHIKVPVTATTLHILDAGIITQSGTPADARLAVRVKGGANIYVCTASSDRAAGHAEADGPLAVFAETASADLEVIMYTAGATYTGTAYVDFGFSTF